MKRKISCPDFAFPLMEHEAVLNLIASLGIVGVDIGLMEDRTHLRPSNQFENLKQNATELKKRVEDKGLVVSDVFIQADLDFFVYAPNHYEESRRQHARDLFQKTVEFASIVGAEHITGMPGAAYPDVESWEESYDRCVKEQQWRADLAKSVGIPYGVEAHIDSLVEQPANAARLCQDAPGMGLTLDYSHFVRLGMEDTAGDILIPYANHVHTRAAAKGVLQTCMSDNVIDFERIVKKLEEAGYAGWYCMEYCWTPNWENCSRNDNISEIILMKERIEEI
ncbi:MAG: sugar phosphate isomerase/epimerase [Lachnospiraceae bacterium]|nr:sugar phosphate isomerase/epimerase [Lachnospiraceae bacterium]